MVEDEVIGLGVLVKATRVCMELIALTFALPRPKVRVAVVWIVVGARVIIVMRVETATSCCG